jgi:hypothetical protein
VQQYLLFQYMNNKDRQGSGLTSLFWNANVIRHSDADLLSALGHLPDIKTVYNLQAGTYGIKWETTEGETSKVKDSFRGTVLELIYAC